MIQFRHSIVVLLLLGLITERVFGFDPNANERVDAIALQSDGKIIIGGRFTVVGGTSRSHLARLNRDGSVDASFNAPVEMAVDSSPTVVALAIQDDGKILVGGRFLQLAGLTRNNLGRLNTDGSVDQTFQPDVRGPFFGGVVLALAIQSDGKILVGGQFTLVNGESRNSLVRLNPEGTLDQDFNPGVAGINNSVLGFGIQPDGRILVGGSFNALAGTSRYRLGRLNRDGSLDLSFDPPCDDVPTDFLLQSGDRIVVAGRFTILANQPCNYLGRLTQTGQFDSTFNPAPDDWVYSMATQADGKILVGGRFTSIGGQPIGRLARLNPDGTVDSSFKTQVELSTCPRCALVRRIVVQPDDRILAGGDFTTLAGAARNYIGRLYPPGSLDEPPFISRMQLISGGQFRFLFSHPQAASLSVFASTNVIAPVANWENLGPAIFIGDGFYQFTDPGVANHPQRFYQLRSP